MQLLRGIGDQIELDHVFILTREGAPEAEALLALGLTESPGRTHAGQGTTNRKFQFANVMLELLWVHDREEARLGLPLLWERWSTGTCPFGLCFRGVAPPFATWAYRPAYWDGAIDIATNADRLDEPMLFFIESARRGSPHAAGPQVTRLELVGPYPDPSPALQTVQHVLKSGPHHRMELGFDGETKGRTADLRPELPLLLHW